MIKILHIIRSNAIAGAENHVFMLLSGLASRSYDVALLSFSDGGGDSASEDYRRALVELERKNVEIFREGVRNKSDISGIRKSRAVIEMLRSDIVHTHMPYADLFGGHAARRAGVKVIVNSRHHDYSTSKWDLRKFKWYYAIANRYRDASIAISECVESLLMQEEGLDPKTVYKVLYGCEDQQVDKVIARRQLREELSVEDDTVVIGTVARLIEWKGHRYAIEALEMLNNRFKNLVWLFVGEGSERESLERLAKTKGLDNLIFTGYRNDVPKIMAGMDIMVHPTRGEGFGLIFLEAMIQSKPIIATNTGSIPEIIQDRRNGFIVNACDAEEIAEALEHFITNRTLIEEMGIQSRIIYEERFTIARMTDEIENIYQELLNAKKERE